MLNHIADEIRAIETKGEIGWGGETFRQPSIEPGDTVLFSEPGRVLPSGQYKVCYRSHWFKIVKAQYGGYFLLVRHGGGQERIKLKYSWDMLAGTFESLDSDSRYLLMWQFMDLSHDAAHEARAATAAHYREAFAEGRLTKRKIRGHNSYRITVAPRITQAGAA